MTGAMRIVFFPAPGLPPWVGFVGAVLFMVALTVLLLVIAKRSDWPPRR